MRSLFPGSNTRSAPIIDGPLKRAISMQNSCSRSGRQRSAGEPDDITRPPARPPASLRCQSALSLAGHRLAMRRPGLRRSTERPMQ